jgi:hypothetical protein
MTLVFTVSQQCRHILLQWHAREGYKPMQLWPDLYRRVGQVLARAPDETDEATYLSLWQEVERLHTGPRERPLLIQIRAALTRQQNLLLEYLWDRSEAIFDELRQIPQAWRRPNPSNDTIHQAVKRLRRNLVRFNVTMTICLADQKIRFERPAN